MQPGISRAIPMGILGFMFGALIVVILRTVQGLDPVWSAGPGIILSVIMGAMFFVWGIGAFDPKLSVHGEEAEEEAAHEEIAEQGDQPRSILFGYTWQITTLLIIFLLLVAGFALIPGGLALTQTVVPGASPATVGYVPMTLPFGGPEIQVSTLVIFIVFILWALVSLVIAAAIFAFVFSFLSRGLVEVKSAGGGTIALPPPSEPQAPPDLRQRITTLVIFVVTFVVLYLVFYYVAIGLIFPQPQAPVLEWFFTPEQQLIIISAVNAFIFMLIILRTSLVLHVVGRVARWLAHVLRSVPRFLQ